MNFRSKIRIFQALLMFGIIFFAVSVAQAGSSHHHHANSVSPFDKVQKLKPLHCVLNMHQHLLNSPCPHKDRDGKNAGQVIRTECGSSSGTANASGSSFVKDLFKGTNHAGFFPLQFYSRIKPPSVNPSHNQPRSIDHPPQLI